MEAPYKPPLSPDPSLGKGKSLLGPLYFFQNKSQEACIYWCVSLFPSQSPNIKSLAPGVGSGLRV